MTAIHTHTHTPLTNWTLLFRPNVLNSNVIVSGAKDLISRAGPVQDVYSVKDSGQNVRVMPPCTSVEIHTCMHKTRTVIATCTICRPMARLFRIQPSLVSPEYKLQAILSNATLPRCTSIDQTRILVAAAIASKFVRFEAVIASLA